MSLPEQLLGRDVPVVGDNEWQRKARLLQSQWRESHGWEAGEHRNSPLASRLTKTDGDARRSYLTPAAVDQVERAVVDAKQTGAVIVAPRIWTDLLSSQPLCFNLFGDMASDVELATEVLTRVWPGHVTRVREIRFEYSPGRGDDVYLGNRSAFDVFVDHDGPAGRSFLAIEVKYHENMRVSAARDNRYTAIARQHGVFRDEDLDALAKPPLQQLWLDHLLALQLRSVEHTRWTAGRFVLLYPSENRACAAVASDYAACLTDPSTFQTMHLETVVQCLREVTGAAWVDELQRRYLGPADSTR